jgi:hypothetical protein
MREAVMRFLTRNQQISAIRARLVDRQAIMVRAKKPIRTSASS